MAEDRKGQVVDLRQARAERIKTGAHSAPKIYMMAPKPPENRSTPRYPLCPEAECTTRDLCCGRQACRGRVGELKLGREQILVAEENERLATIRVFKTLLAERPTTPSTGSGRTKTPPRLATLLLARPSLIASLISEAELRPAFIAFFVNRPHLIQGFLNLEQAKFRRFFESIADAILANLLEKAAPAWKVGWSKRVEELHEATHARSSLEVLAICNPWLTGYLPAEVGDFACLVRHLKQLAGPHHQSLRLLPAPDSAGTAARSPV